MLFRQPAYDATEADAQATAELAKRWNVWLRGIADEGKLGNTGARLADAGKVLKRGGVITDGPFVEIKEQLGGFMIVLAEDMDDALTLAHGCPVIELGGSVEIRPLTNPRRV